MISKKELLARIEMLDMIVLDQEEDIKELQIKVKALEGKKKKTTKSK